MSIYGMSRAAALAALPLLATIAMPAARAGTVADAVVERIAPDRIAIRWKDADPVDVLQSDSADAAAVTATLLSARDGDGMYEVQAASGPRPYFLLRDTKSGAVTRVAERVLTMQQSSNFRDLGGYPAASGKHVRWGRIYRSGGQAMLTDADVAQVKALGVANLVDLRSDEERLFAPTRLDGIPYQAVGYSMAAIMGTMKLDPRNMDPSKQVEGYASSYRSLPTQLAPQLRIIFRRLLSKEGPLLYNCSAGQDRTGFASAMILSALGVPRDTIYADYLLSTPSRRPQYEVPPISDAVAQTSPVAGFFAQMQKGGAMAKANPLVLPDGTPFLSHAFAEIDRKWGSVDAYLAQEIGLTPVDVAALRATYLE